MAEFSPASLVAVIVLIALNGFFVAAEFALVSVRRTRIQELSDEGSRRASMVKAALDDINQYVSTAQVGITICSLSIGFLGEPAVAALLEPSLGSVLSGQALHVVSFVLTLTILTYFHVVLGEVAPKNMALQKAERIALFAIPMISFLRRAFSPLVWVFNGTADAVLRMLRIEPAPGMHMIHSEEELKMLVSQSQKGGVLEDTEQEMLYNVFDFADTDVAQVMVPRPDVVGFPVDMDPAELLTAVANQPFTRYPIYRGSMDDVLGILHIRDLFTAAEQQGKEHVRVESLLRPAHVVPESKSLAGLLADFRRSKSHMALVIDEYGSLAGVATLEDLIEEIVGEIDDEHDRPERPLEVIGEGHVRVDGKFLVEELNDRFDLALPSDDYNTIGGVVFGLLGQAPHEGDVVRLGNLRMEVVETDGPRIVHVDLIMRADSGSGDDGSREPTVEGENLGDVSGLDHGDDSPATDGDLDLIPGHDTRSTGGGGPDR
ncbi:MAG: HlyC/CorC family transporter [Thermoleophilia bacterium]|nr:HlyC/CorC family transporter [Thermoleophilia bacterium]